MIKLLKNLKLIDWIFLFFTICLIIMQVWLELKMPDYTAKLTELIQGENTDMSLIWKNGGLMFACAVGSLFLAVICSFVVSRVASSLSKTLRAKLYNKISDFSDAEIKAFSIPSLITRTTNDVMQIQNFMAMGVRLLFKAPITAVWAIIKISNTNIKWTIAVLISVIIIVVCVCILIAICFPRFKKIQKLTDDINNITRENISGIRVVRAFNAEKYQEDKFEEVNNNITKTHLVTSRTLGFMGPIMTIVMNGISLAIYWIGALLINEIVLGADFSQAIAQRISLLGNMVAFIQYAMQVISSFMMLIMIFIILPRTMVSATRINKVLEKPLSIKNGNIEFVKDKHGEIEFKNVCFSYPDSKQGEKALYDISFKVKKGETLAIIGATGSAKTTLINLIPRIYDVSSGEVLISGVNVKDYDEKYLRQKIAVATQKAVLFKGSVKDNITYGSTHFDQEKLNNAIEIAHADFINQLENKMESEVAQGGTNFSGGQKQRLSIARAVYKDAEIFIFDDTFSALDYKTDMLVRKSIKENLSDKTIIIVAQRIGTIKDADNIIVLDEGKIVGQGKHSELLKKCSIYKEIALSQLSKEEL